MKTTSLLLAFSLLATSTALWATAPEVVHDFSLMANPMEAMTLGSDGHFYGVTTSRRGGPYGSSPDTYYAQEPGSIYQYKLDGTFTVLSDLASDQSEG